MFFADDINMFLSDHNFLQLIEKANQELIFRIEWLQCNKLSVCVSKSNFIIFF
jgi:hypothetical protein